MSDALKRCKDKAIVLHLRGIGGIGKSSLLDYWTSTIDSTIRLDCQQHSDFYIRLNVLAKGASLLGIKLQRFDVLWQIRQRFVEGVEPVKEAGREWAKDIAMAIPFIGSLASIGSAINAVGSKVAPKLKGKYGTLGKWLQDRLGKNHVARLLEILWKEPRHAEFLYLDAFLEDLNSRKSSEPLLFLLDHFEYVDSEMAHWRYGGKQIVESDLWCVFLTSLQNSVGVMASRRSAPEELDAEIEATELTELDKESCHELLDLRGIGESELQERIVSVSGGNPFVIGALCDMAESGDLEIHEIEDLRSNTLEEVRLKTWRKLFSHVKDLSPIIDRAGLLPFFNRQILTIVLPELKTDHWDRLIRLSFVKSRDDGSFVHHDLAKELVIAELGDRINTITKEVAEILKEAALEKTDHILLGLSRSVQGLVSPEETMKLVLMDGEDLIYEFGEEKLVPYLTSVRIDTSEGRSFTKWILGSVIYGMGRIADGEHLLKESLELSEEIANAGASSGLALAAMTLTNLGRLYTNSSRISEAKDAFERSIAIWEKIIEDEEYTLSVFPAEPMYHFALLFYGELFRTLKDYSKARVLLSQAVQFYEVHFDLHEVKSDRYRSYFEYLLPFTKIRLGWTLFYTGDLSEAEKIMRDVYENAKRLLNRTVAMWSLEEIFRVTSRPYEAEELCIEIVNHNRELVVKSSAAKDDYTYLGGLARSLGNLASIYAMTGRYKEAEETYSESLSLSRKLVDKSPEFHLPTLSWILRDLGILTDWSGKYPESEDMHKEALEIGRGLAKQSSAQYLSKVVEVLNNYALTLFKTNQRAEASEMLKEALETAEQNIEGIPDAAFLYEELATILNNMGLFLRNEGSVPESYETLSRALSIQKEQVSKSRAAFEFGMSVILGNLGITLYEMNEHEKAEENLRKSVAILRNVSDKSPDQYLSNLVIGLKNLSILFERTKREEDANKYYEEALEILDQLESKAPQFDLRVSKIKPMIERKSWIDEFREILNPP
jgi:tetratricopeptide (TPR) repeat protein